MAAAGSGYVYLFESDGTLQPSAGQNLVTYQFALESGLPVGMAVIDMESDMTVDGSREGQAMTMRTRLRITMKCETLD